MTQSRTVLKEKTKRGKLRWTLWKDEQGVVWKTTPVSEGIESTVKINDPNYAPVLGEEEDYKRAIKELHFIAVALILVITVTIGRLVIDAV